MFSIRMFIYRASIALAIFGLLCLFYNSPIYKFLGHVIDVFIECWTN